MRRISIILDAEPEVIHLWNQWEAKRARIEKNLLIVEWPHGILIIEALDAQLVADLFFTHDPKGDIVKGKLGIQKVAFEKKPSREDAEGKLIEALKELMRSE